jgi:acyl-CoA synthetase (AMP-forming)/AMP-acid ligase II
MNRNWNDLVIKYFYKKEKEFIKIGSISLTKHEIYERIFDFSNVLQYNLKRKRFFIYIALPSDISFIIAFFGILCSGNVPIIVKPYEDLNDKIEGSFKISLDKNESDFLFDEKYVFYCKNREIQNPKIMNWESDFFIYTSGSTQKPRCIGITFRNVQTNIHLHLNKISHRNGTTLSVLPYFHIFGLVLDLFLSLEFQNSIMISSTKGKEIDFLAELLGNIENVYMCGVPRIFEELIEKKLLSRVKKCSAGIVGGASISSSLANSLRGSNFYVGYGQTEASPGILLGDRGEFWEAYLGKAIGVSVAISNEGTLLFKGENSYIEYMETGEIFKLKPYRWVDSGDLVSEVDGRYFYRGRVGYSFKLSNGRWVVPEEIEREMQKKTGEFKEFFIAERIGGGIELFVNPRENGCIELVKKSLPDYLLNEKISIQTVFLWSKDSKGNVDRQKMKLEVLDTIRNSL